MEVYRFGRHGAVLCIVGLYTMVLCAELLCPDLRTNAERDHQRTKWDPVFWRRFHWLLCCSALALCFFSNYACCSF
jgi:hypothetical protein